MGGVWGGGISGRVRALNLTVPLGSGRVRRSRVRAGFGLQFWARADLCPKGIQDAGDFVSSVEHRQRCLTQTVAVCQSYNGSQWDSRLWEKKKTYIDKTKLNPAARDDTLRSKDTNRSVCARNWTYLYRVFLTSDPPHCPTVLSTFTTAACYVSLSSCFMADRRFISAFPPPISQMDHWHSIYTLN